MRPKEGVWRQEAAREGEDEDGVTAARRRKTQYMVAHKGLAGAGHRAARETEGEGEGVQRQQVRRAYIYHVILVLALSICSAAPRLGCRPAEMV